MNKRLNQEQCYRYFRENHTPPHVIMHCMAVSRTAVRIAEELNRHGYDLDVELIRYAALIHDVCRKTEDHDQAAADMLERDGYIDEAPIVRAHMHYQFTKGDDYSETDMVCLGDRTVTEHTYVGCDRRFDYLLKKRDVTPERIAHMEKAKAEIHRFISGIEEKIGCPLDSLFLPSMDHILRQVEKPARYTGGEINSIRKDPRDVRLRFAFAFPDLYEIGMSYMGLQIIYHIINSDPDLSCERVFAPAPDMEQHLRDAGYPLFTLENRTPVAEMDAVGFTLQYEMSFTNILNMPLHACDRGEQFPLVLAGGPCAFNPEPLADFIDAFLIGDGEEMLPQVLHLIADARKQGMSKEETLQKIASVKGVYVPRFYEPEAGFCFGLRFSFDKKKRGRASGLNVQHALRKQGGFSGQDHSASDRDCP